ncbi:hypothetical protein [Sandaracinus amylolyticus]|uniref:Uncharacterized protein n=1 Tax=Sandaracinus amylolyticus TaxID=927083 RepID=A0A0F6YHQ9_9BACT|nr:hypothetical protein [Sandaracinus amylolyticus]AKF05341.1 hypothetical protein DB32_002490 [Sandaracinus amylolyticus]
MSLARFVAAAALSASVLSSSLFHHGTALAQEGTVRVPLATWQQLASAAPTAPRASIGVTRVMISVDDELVATVRASVAIRAREAGAEALVLPPGVVLREASANGAPIDLAPTRDGLVWIVETAGSHSLELVYDVPGARADDGASIGIPLPLAPSVQVSAVLPADAASASFVPAINPHFEDGVLEAIVPGGSGALLAWRTLEATTTPAPSRALYRGELASGAVRFEAELDVELAHDEAVLVPLFPRDVALAVLEVDRTAAPIRTTDDGRLAALVRGRGRHVLHATFEVPITSERGLPGARVPIPEVPVSRFELAIPGDKDVRVEPAVAVHRTRRGASTLVSFHVPMRSEVQLAWPEALPETAEGAPELRAAATLVHVVRAEEGLLRATAHVEYQLARGSASRLELRVPHGVEVDAVRADAAEVADFRVAGERERVLTVFLDRAFGPTLAQDVVALEIDYEVLLGRAGPFEVPLLEARGVRRQRGLAALLATRDLVLEPASEEGLVRVGENQLPAAIRARIDATIAHVFRWSDAPPALRATTATRPREAARFDARLDALVSLGDASTTAWAAIDVRVKSGSLSELVVALPEGASLLDVVAPSLREHRLEGSRVRLSFTQEMEGDVHVELRWERIVAAGETELDAPMAHVEGADVEQGRVAIEATAAVEVEPARAEGLSPVEVSELPEELVVRSESPVLLAYRWAHASPAPRLALRVARHRRAELREAAIDDATYRTLVTSDGLAVTVATWMVRNEREQFLRVALPAGSELWSARVGGRAETPAIAGDVLMIGVVRAEGAFPVEIVYATPIARLGALGRLALPLARPEAIAARTRWEVLLPDGARWSAPSSELAVRSREPAVGEAPFVHGIAMQGGERIVLEGLFVEREGRAPSVSIAYASGAGVALGWLLGIVGALLVWVGLLGVVMARSGVIVVPEQGEAGMVELATYRVAASAQRATTTRRGVAALAASAVLGAAVLAVALGWLETSAWGPVGMSGMFVAGLGIAARRRIAGWLASVRARVGAGAAGPG